MSCSCKMKYILSVCHIIINFVMLTAISFKSNVYMWMVGTYNPVLLH